MKNSKPLLLPLLGLALLVGSCARFSGESSSESNSSSGASSLSSSSGDSASSQEGDSLAGKLIDAAFIEKAAASSLEGKGTLLSDGYLSSVDFFLGPNSLDFFDYDGNYGLYYASHMYRRAEDGSTVAYIRDVNNKIPSSPLYVEGATTVKAPWANYFYNPFLKLSAADLSLKDGTYEVKADKVQAFSIPLMHYGVGTFDRATIKRDGDSLSIVILATAESGSPMEMKLELTLGGAVDRPVPEPFESETYHQEIGEALDAWSNALSGPSDPTGFVYERTMTPLDNDEVEVGKSRSIVTHNATLFESDGGITSSNDWGYALYDDGNVYEFEVVDGKAVRGERYEGGVYPIPWPNIVAPEMFAETEEEGVYAYRDGPSVPVAASYFLEEADLIAYLSYQNAAKDLTIRLGEDGIVENFAFTIPMVSPSGDVYSERVSVDILDFDKATIDYDFTIPKIDIPAGMIETWHGRDTYTLKEYTLVISEEEATLNGETAELLGLMVDEWGVYKATLKVGADSYDLAYRPAISFSEAEINLTAEGVDVALSVYEPVTMPSGAIGTWEGVDEETSDVYRVVIDESGSISINGVDAVLGDWEETTTPGGYRVQATVDGKVYYLTYRVSAFGGVTFTLTDEEGLVLSVKLSKVEEGGEPSIDPKYVGTWVGVDDTAAENTHTLVVNADGTATYDGVPFDEPLVFEKGMLSEKAEATIEGKEYTVEYSSLLGNVSMKVTEADTLVEAVLYLQEEAAPVFEVPSWCVGTYRSSDGAHTLVISESGSISFDGVAASAVDAVETDQEWGGTITFGSIVYDFSIYKYMNPYKAWLSSGDSSFLLTAI